MFKAKAILSMFGALFVGASMASAAIVMDATTNNGSFDGSTNGNWATYCPTGWEASASKNLIYTAYEIPMLYDGSTAINNTGVLVAANTTYTLSALMDANVNLTANIWVMATANADGTGSTVELAHISFNNGTTSGAIYSPRTNIDFMTAVGPTTGAATDNSVAGYYVQVRMASTDLVDYATPYSWYDNIVVTSNPVPEPVSLGLLLPAAALFLSRRQRQV